MPQTIPQSPNRRRVVAAILSAGTTGATRADVVRATQLSPKTVGMYMRNLRAAGEIFAGLKGPDTGRYHRYVAAEHYGAYCKSNGLQAPPELLKTLQAKAAQKAAEQTPLPASRAPRVGAPLPRMSNPYRDAVVRALDAATAPLTTAELSLAAAVSINGTRSAIGALVREGRAANVGTAQRSRWAKATPSERPARIAAARPEQRLCNSSTPTVTISGLPRMGSTRPGADDHLQAPSLRADGRVGYRVPMLIASTVTGGARAC